MYDRLGTFSSEAQNDIHHFVWDRTRQINQDISVQNLRTPGVVRILERIIRYVERGVGRSWYCL
jgi:hypothetical protein